MFVNAIEEIQKFTRPVHTILRHYQNTFIQPGAATLFFINEDGFAVTCKHVLDLLIQEKIINNNYTGFRQERAFLGTKIDGKYKKMLKDLEMKYNYTSTESVAQLKNSLINCTDSGEFDYIPHPTLDLAVLRFKEVKQKHYVGYARFLKDGSRIKPGKYLCRFGFPFAEFTNFLYDNALDEIVFTTSGNMSSPPFPIEGMVTRLVGEGGKIVGIEMSTPGLRGQSGGPLFDADGIVYGMQSHTVQYHMGFDEQKIEIISKGKKTNTINHSFLNVGRCIHVDAIKDFLRVNNVMFYEE